MKKIMIGLMLLFSFQTANAEILTFIGGKDARNAYEDTLDAMGVNIVKENFKKGEWAPLFQTPGVGVITHKGVTWVSNDLGFATNGFTTTGAGQRWMWSVIDDYGLSDHGYKVYANKPIYGFGSWFRGEWDTKLEFAIDGVVFHDDDDMQMEKSKRYPSVPQRTFIGFIDTNGFTEASIICKGGDASYCWTDNARVGVSDTAVTLPVDNQAILDCEAEGNTWVDGDCKEPSDL